MLPASLIYVAVQSKKFIFLLWLQPSYQFYQLKCKLDIDVGSAGGNGDEEGSESEREDVDKERLRFYERSRLRYFYAVAEFDSAATANRIYEECDGLEFEHSACRIDMRFVPADLDLSQRQVSDGPISFASLSGVQLRLRL
eukprot:scaffold233687_cov23-Prasinocladus_malaysianus.AAC.1